MAEMIELDASRPEEAERIRRLTVDSYRVEAELLGVDDFPPLARTAAAIRAAPSRFFGLRQGGALVAVAELEESDGGEANIAGFTVHPRVFRRGYGGQLLAQLLERIGARRVTVSTGRSNLPALALYERHGFRADRLWTTPCGIPMVTLAREPER